MSKHAFPLRSFAGVLPSFVVRGDGARSPLDSVKAGGARRFSVTRGSGMDARTRCEPSDINPDEPYVMDAFQQAELQAIRDRRKLDKFVSKLPAPSLRPRLVRIASKPVEIPSTSDAGQPDTRLDPPRQTPVRSLYNRHGLTSRGRKVPAGIQAAEERTIPGATIYPPLPAQSTRFYAVRAKS